MKTVQLTISTMTTKHIIDSVNIAFNNYRNDPSVKSLLASINKNKEERLLKIYFQNLINLNFKFGTPLVVRYDEKTIGFALIYPAKRYPIPVLHQTINTVLLLIRFLLNGVTFSTLMRLTRILSELSDLFPKEPCNYLELFVVNHEFKNKGFSKLVFGFLSELSLKNGHSIYLETSNPTNIPIFNKYGFSSIRKTCIDGIDYWSFSKGVVGNIG